MQADLILTGGRILTMAGRRAEAVAVLRDRVVAVGGADEIGELRGPRTHVVDLGGRVAMAGFTDSHLHLAALSLLASQVDLRRATSLRAALRRVAARVRAAQPGQWILGSGVDKNRWGGDFPTRADLDAVAPRNPVALRTRDGHSLWVNSLALDMCGITAGTPDPPGGAILRDARGAPTGILQESAAGLVYGAPAFARRAPNLAEIQVALRLLIRQGITSAHVMEEVELLGALQRLRTAGQLGPRLTIYCPRGSLDELLSAELRSGFGDEWLRIGGVKLLIDGSLGSQTAWLFRPYPGGGFGVPVLWGEELRDTVARAARGGLACAVHAIGDRANAEALAAFGAARRWPTPLPHRIEHAQLLRERDIHRLARLGVVASMQPCHILGDIGPAERYWGKRSRWAYPIRSLLRAGTTLAFGSDAPVETTSVPAGVYAAVCRQTLSGEPPGGWYRREEGIGPDAALAGYTLGPAVATGEQALKGRLAPGYLADIVVLSQDMSRLRSRRLLDTRVDMVFIGGRLRFRRRAG